LRLLREAELPGDAVDHEWMGERIQAAAEKLTDRFPAEYGQDLIISGLALELGLDLSKTTDLETRVFPQPWLSSIPRLLQCGFPKASWRLIESGVLRYEPNAVDAVYAWRLDLTRIPALTQDCYELGEDLLVRVISEGLMGITHQREQDSRIRIIAPTLTEGRSWRKRLEGLMMKQGSRKRVLLTVGAG
jgi:hypothetical protein